MKNGTRNGVLDLTADLLVAQRQVDGIGRLDDKLRELKAERELLAGVLKEKLGRLLAAGFPAEVSGAEYRAVLVPQEVTPAIDPRRFKKVCPPSQFYGCVMVAVGKAREVLGDVVLRKLAPPEPGTPRLTVERKNGKGS